MGVAATGRTDLAYEVTKATATEIAACGVNLMLGPVLDVLNNARYQPLGVRATGDDPQEASSYGLAALNGIKDAGARAVRFAQMNVDAGVKVLMANPVIKKAIDERGLQVHGTLFDIASGCLQDLGVGTKSSKAGARQTNGGSDGTPEEIIRGQHATLVFGAGGAGMKAH